MLMEPRPLRLSLGTAKRMIRKELSLSASHLQASESNNERYQRFTMTQGSLSIKIENDWLTHNQRFRLSICDPAFGKEIIMYFFPATLERDCLAESREYQDLKNEQIEQWAYGDGLESCIKQITGILNGLTLCDK